MLTRIKTLSAVLLLSAAGLLVSAPEVRASCQYGVYDSTPSAERRWVKKDGYQFLIPENYKAQLNQDGSISVIDPDTVQYLACIRRNNVGVGLPYPVTVSTIDSRVNEGDWPYNIPGFEWFGQITQIQYGNPSAQATAVFSHWSDFDDSWILHAVQNLSQGKAAYVRGSTDDEEARSVFLLAWISLFETDD